MTRVYRLHVAMVDEYWPVASRLLAPAIERSQGDHSLETTLEALKSGHSQLWVIHGEDGITAAAITSIAVYPTGQKWLEVAFLGGCDAEEWVRVAMDAAMTFARERGCKGSGIIGRRGWQRHFPDFEEAGVILRKVA